MFNILSDRITKSINKINSKTILTEDNIKEVLRDIRIALLESDVNFKVIKKFTAEIQQKCLGLNLANNLNPGQTVIDIVHSELVSILGSSNKPLQIQDKFCYIMLVGIQGSGKTTTNAKLAYYIKNKLKKSVLMVGLDVYRPGAMHQLSDLAKQMNFPVHIELDNKDPLSICKNALNVAKNFEFEVVLFDTAGRMQINDALMEELRQVKKLVRPSEIIFVIDAMAGQNSINVVKKFHEEINLTGVVLTKTDSDAKGGIALSINYLTNLPIKFVGTGERIKDLDLFYPDRMANQILNLGDIMTLIEQGKSNIDEKSAKRSINRMISGKFNLIDLVTQMKQLKKMGKLNRIIKLIPGAPKLSPEQIDKAEEKLKVTEILINSMTDEEKKSPHLLKDHQRKQRIVKGSGRSNSDYANLLKDWEEMKKGMKNMKSFFS